MSKCKYCNVSFQYCLETSAADDDNGAEMDPDIMHMITLSNQIVEQKLIYWLADGVEPCPAEYFTHRCLNFTDMCRELKPLFA